MHNFFHATFYSLGAALDVRYNVQLYAAAVT
nr:MAG TPA: hypothetical protein [Caudoviricetes sp.]